MSTFIYISGSQMQVITASGEGRRAKVNNAYLLTAPEGSVINGTIMDTESFVPFMKNFFESNKISTKDVNLVLNSRKIVGKTLEIPQVSVNKTLEFISREFGELDRDEGEGVYCFASLENKSSGKMRRVYAETMSRGFVKEYLDIFQSIGINLQGIYSNEGPLIKLVSLSAAQLRKTFVVQIADDNLLTNVVWVDGEFYYYSSQRCFQEVGTPEYFEECVRTLNQIAQFMRANHSTSEIETIYVGGMTEENAASYRHSILESEVEATVDVFSCGLDAIQTLGADAQMMLFAISGLIGQEKSSNMLTNYKEEKKSDQGASKNQILLVAGVLVVMLLILGVSLVFKFMMDAKVKELEDYTQDPMVQADLMDYEYYVYEENAARNKLSSMKTIGEQIDTYPVLTSPVIQKLVKTAGDYASIDIQSFNAESGVIRFTVSAHEVEDINKYIAEMTKLETFSQVQYTGYTYNEQEDMWDVHVSCIMAESEGR